MQLKTWNVWHNYSSYFHEPIDLKKASRSLVSSGLCVVTYHSDNTLTWKVGRRTTQGSVTFDRLGHDEYGTISLPENLDRGVIANRSYVLTCALQATRAHMNETTTFSDFVAEAVPFVRGFLEPSRIKVDDAWVLMYPQVKVFANGVYTFQLRIISPSEKTLSSDDLITNYINLYTKNSYDLEVAPAVMHLDARNYGLPQTRNLIRRIQFAWEVRATQAWIKEKAKPFGTEFDFMLFHADTEQTLTAPEYNLQGFNEFLYSALDAALNNHRGAISYVFFGRKKSKYNRGGFWSGRPNIHVLSFDGQPPSHKELKEKFGPTINNIVSRVTSRNTQVLEDLEPPTAFSLTDDKSLHFGEATSLFIYLSGIEEMRTRLREPDPNNDEFIYPNQVIAEMVEYLRLSYYRFEGLFSRSSLTQTQINREREALLRLDGLFGVMTNSGMLNRVFLTMREVLGIGTMRERIKNFVDIKVETAKAQQERTFRNYGWFVAITFGLAGISGFSQQILSPTWKALCWWTPPLQWQPIYFFGITLGVFSLIIGLIAVTLLRKH